MGKIQRDFATAIFEKHYEFYKKFPVETIKQQAGQVEQVSSDYQGRVIYELLQNAFDKAKKNILVKVSGNVLYIANDGTKFNYAAEYDFEKNSTVRGDFQSLCSISTSTKNAATSIGNKGVGFKSVFSIAEKGFVNIHTKGEIIKKGEEIIDSDISFRIYDSFKSLKSIPKEFDSKIRENLKEKIMLVQQEFRGRGVPGFYFPLQIKNDQEIINELFKKDFVTVIEIPFGQVNEHIVKSLIDEIEKLHFQFIKLKYDKDFEITFDFRGEVIKQKVKNELKDFFSAELQNDELIQLARKIDINIEKPVIAFYINYKSDGVLFNYLPSKVLSPFKNIDFHADFQTKVDRTNINFDRNSDVGSYNRALLHACIELLFLAINNSLEPTERVDLNLRWIDKKLFQKTAINFDWRIFETNNPSEIFHEVKSLLKILDWEYTLASNFITKLAQEFFNKKRTINEYNLFYDTISEFLEQFSSNTNQYYLWVERFKDVLAPELLSSSCNLLPNITLSNSKEVFYKKRNDKSLHLPNFIDVSVTDFEIKDKYLRKKLGIKDFEDYNEILKYFKQVSYSGNYQKESITESQQLELLKSLIQIMNSKKETFSTCSHRYSRIFTAEERRNSSIINQAYFNVSSMFLKTYSGNYKPAQLCKKEDLDQGFLNKLDLADDLDNFLQFIGVSLDPNYIFCDLRIYSKLHKGIDYIPALIKNNEVIDNLFGEALLKNIRLFTVKNKEIHPALINDNNYSFLENVSGRKIKAELDNLKVKNYDNFPKEYLEILFERIQDMPSGIERLYLSLFYSFHTSLKKYLVSFKNNLEWKSKKDDFFIAQNRQDYEVLKKQDIPLLIFHNGNEIPDELADRKVTLIESEIIFNISKDITEETMKLIDSKICYMLAEVSKTSLSDLNFKENSNRVAEIQRQLYGCKVYECKSLFQEIISNKAGFKFENSSEALFDKQKNAIYFIENCSNRSKAELLSKYLFNNNSISSVIELILFHKEAEVLEVEFEREDTGLFRKLWDKDYEKKFNDFQNEVLIDFVDYPGSVLSDWYIYDKRYKSSLLLKIFNDGKLHDLEKRIQIAKQKFDNLFDDFQLEIDFSLNDISISKMILFLETQGDEESKNFIIELRTLSKGIGKETRLIAIEEELNKKYHYSDLETLNNRSVNQTQEKLNLDRKVNSIFEKLPVSNRNVSTTSFTAAGESKAMILAVNKKKLIFQGGHDSGTEDLFLEETGAIGEEQVLGYYINIFMLLTVEERQKAIKAIYQIIQEKLGNDSHKTLKDECLKNIEIDSELKKALIPYFYISMHHKFSYFDLIAYENHSPIIVEVKTTSSLNNDSFYISVAEVNEALKEPNYQIVRVTPNEIIFMGNPIKQLGDKLTSVSGNNYKLTPRNYKFEFIKASNHAQ